MKRKLDASSKPCACQQRHKIRFWPTLLVFVDVGSLLACAGHTQGIAHFSRSSLGFSSCSHLPPPTTRAAALRACVDPGLGAGGVHDFVEVVFHDDVMGLEGLVQQVLIRKLAVGH